MGVWIEISFCLTLSLDFLRHSPWWECGLKLLLLDNLLPNLKSLPLVGVWIEIICADLVIADVKVTPLGGSVD